MDRAAYEAMGAIERSHWWYVGRRTVIRSLVSREVALPLRPRILDAGCGTGGNLEFLKSFGSLDAFEYDDEARAMARAKSGMEIAAAGLPNDLGSVGDGYDMITLLDVLEHIPDDVGSLKALGEKLAPSGKMVLTVPAVPQLWSSHDEVHHHLRRYTRKSLEEAIRKSGLRPKALGYFNSLLFPLAVVERITSKMRGRTEADPSMPPAPLNKALSAVFSAEAHLVGRLPMPIGLSLYAVIDLLD